MTPEQWVVTVGIPDLQEQSGLGVDSSISKSIDVFTVYTESRKERNPQLVCLTSSIFSLVVYCSWKQIHDSVSKIPFDVLLGAGTPESLTMYLPSRTCAEELHLSSGLRYFSRRLVLRTEIKL